MRDYSGLGWGGRCGIGEKGEVVEVFVVLMWGVREREKLKVMLVCLVWVIEKVVYFLYKY